jgi:cytochrome bd-type quinol oxidase subunit 2
VTPLRNRIKNALDEVRILVLGTQVLLGFAYRGFFEPRFERLPPRDQRLVFVSLCLLLFQIGILLLPAARHRLVERGTDTEALHRFAMNCAFVALLPFSVVLGLHLFLASASISGEIDLLVPLVIVAVALVLWYGIAVLRGPAPERPERVEELKLEDKIVQVLTEARVVLPGAQALVGFQLAITLMDAYEKLPRSSKELHLAALAADALAVIFLMAPAAYHRIVERGEDTERFHRFASAMVLLALAVLPVAFALDLGVVVRKQTESIALAWVAGVTTAAFFYGLWFVAMLVVRVRRR